MMTLHNGAKPMAFHLQLTDEYEAQERDIAAALAFRPQRVIAKAPKRWILMHYVGLIGLAFILVGVGMIVNPW